jgi:hypothetical protein
MPGLMNLKKVENHLWFELDQMALVQISLVAHELKSFSSTNSSNSYKFMISPGYERAVFDSSLELLQNLVQFMDQYYPNYLTCNTDEHWIYHSALQEKYYYQTVYYSEFKKETNDLHPLLLARLLVGDDLVIMLRKASIQESKQSHDIHILAGAALFFPDNWKLEEKLGLPLAAIHYPVNSLNIRSENLQHHTFPSQNPIVKAMERYFTSLHQEEGGGGGGEKVPMVHERFNWSFQHHPQFLNRFGGWYEFLQSYIQSFVLLLCGMDERLEYIFRASCREFIVILFNFLRQFLSMPLFEIYLRTERQTLRLLPQSHGIVFGIRTRVNPLREALDTKEKAATLKTALEEEVPINENSGKGLFRVELLHWIERQYNLKSQFLRK